jgi:hypothetical protein
LDENHEELSEDQYNQLDLHVEHHQDTVQFVRLAPSDARSSAANRIGCRGQRYAVKGVKLGGAVVTFSASHKDGRLFSNPLSIEVTK